MRDFVLLRRYRRQWTPKTRHAFCIFVGAHGERLSIDARTAEITNLLKAWGSGDEAALAQLTEHVYPELRLHGPPVHEKRSPGQQRCRPPY